jgi:carboxylate-amine ligase
MGKTRIRSVPDEHLVRSPSTWHAPTVGVEEEYFLLRPDDATLTPVAGRVITRALSLLEDVGAAGCVLQPELLRTQLEVATPVCTNVVQVDAHLRTMRSYLAVAAWREGAVLAPIGTPPADTSTGPGLITDDPRYLSLYRRSPELVQEQLVSGMHVHVGVPSRDAGVTVLNRLRPWLHVVLALASNSPLWGGTDTGFASWRSVQGQRWPLHGPPPRFSDAIEYDGWVNAVVDQGVVDDRGQLYWSSRLSDLYPTVEIRVPDVQLTVTEATMVVTLVRALVAHALHDAWDGVPEPDLTQDTVQHAHWLAARSGTGGDLLDLADRTSPAAPARPAATVVDRLLDQLLAVRPLRAEVEAAVPLVAAAMSDGGAARQRRAVTAGGVPGLVDMLRGGPVIAA